MQVLTTSVSFWQLNQDFLLKKLLHKMLKGSSLLFQPWNHPFEKQTPKPQAFRTRSQYDHTNRSHSKNCTINGPFIRGLSRQGIISHKTPVPANSSAHFSCRNQWDFTLKVPGTIATLSGQAAPTGTEEELNADQQQWTLLFTKSNKEAASSLKANLSGSDPWK